MPDHYFGGGSSQTTIAPPVLVAMLLAIALIWFLPRKYVFVPFLLVAILAPMENQIVVAGVHLFVLRIIILAGLCRVFVMKYISGRPVLAARWNKVDQFFFLWAICHACAGMLLWGEAQAAVNQIGFLWTNLGGYVLIRSLIQDEDDTRRAIITLAAIVFVISALMVQEQHAHRNLFGWIGGSSVPEVRDGRIRSQGPFAHALLAGSFGATCVPLFVWLWHQAKLKWMAAVGVVSSGVMAITAACSTPILACLAGILAVGTWPLRRNLRAIRWGLVSLLVLLELVMKAQVWFLIAHIDVTGSSSGYHRAMLIDTFVRHTGDWWLLGTKDAFNWGWDMWDTCNQFVQEGENGGLFTLVCFIAVIVFCFKRMGAALALRDSSNRKRWSIWFFGCALFANIVAFFGIAYFDQTQILWLLLLACIITATSSPATPLMRKHALNLRVTDEDPVEPPFEHRLVNLL